MCNQLKINILAFWHMNCNYVRTQSLLVMNNSRVLRNMKVFIVDDDLFCSNLYRHSLSQTGLENIYLFQTGEECLRNITMSPDIVLLDNDMANMDGLQVIKHIRNRNPSIHVLMVSARKENDIAVEALASGAATFILKDGNETAHLNYAVSKIISNYTRRFSLSKHIKTAAVS